MSHRNGPVNLHYHNAIKSTITSAVYTPTTNIVTDPLTDRYVIGENIGRGKFAVVRQCTHKQTNEVVAAKFIKKRRRGKSCREEILREVVMLEMALDHPRLVNLKEVYETQQELILITEYCAGGELFTECILEEKFDESDVRLLMAQILEGLVYLHEKNIVHLDLKPQNILLTDEFPKGSVKICDLGFACLVNTGEDIRDIIGTPDYVAPEVLNYDSLGLYTDMWSLGVLTYVMLTTCSPFQAEDKQMTFSNITTVNFDFPEELFGNISMAAQDFIQKLLIAEPGDRMTAKECFEHEWLQGVFHSNKSLTSCDSDNPEISSSDLPNSIPRNHSLGVLVDNDIGYSDDMNVSTANDSDNSDNQSESTSRNKVDSDNQSESSSRNKVVEQSSEMSVRDDEGVNVETDTNLQTETKSDDINKPVNDSPDTEPLFLQNPPVTMYVSEPSPVTDNVSTYNELPQVDITQDTEFSEQSRVEITPDTEFSEPPLVEITPDTELSVPSRVDITPDTDSSVLMSDTKLHESDSGMVTGSECRSLESVYFSGRTSAEPEFFSGRTSTEPDFSEIPDFSENINRNEINEDFEMQMENKGLLSGSLGGSIEDVAKETDKDVDTGCEDYIVSAESEHDMDIEQHTGNITDPEILQMNENNSAKNTTMPEQIQITNEISGLSDSEICSKDILNSSSFSDNFNVNEEQSSPIFGSFSNENKYANTPTPLTETRPHLNSVGNIDDSINSMQLGERHKRGMCNDPNLSDNPDNEEQEYEFVSVSKRVRSIEEANTVVTASPEFSPKIARSPRIARNSRFHPHQHH